MCGPIQLFFFQCGLEMPKGWTPLLGLLVLKSFLFLLKENSLFVVWGGSKALTPLRVKPPDPSLNPLQQVSCHTVEKTEKLS